MLIRQRFSIGHPEIIREDFNPIDNYFGFVKCKKLPPNDLYLPVIPLYVDGKLMFPLCSKCAQASSLKDTGYADMHEINHRSEHSNDEKAHIGAWTTEEILMAQKVGYIVMDKIEVAHYQKSSDSLFSKYINKWLKIKLESSGWPESCERESAKTKYIEEYFSKE